MQVFKTCFKVINKNKLTILIYFATMILVSAILSSLVYSQTNSGFSETKSKLAVFNEDKDEPLTEGLISYLSDNAVIVHVDDNSESIQDALFYDSVDYTLRIPKGFAESFMSGKAPKLEKNTSAATAAAAGIDLLVNKYLGIADIYRANINGADQAYIAKNTAADLEKGTDIKLEANKVQRATSKLSFYFMFSAYPILAILIMSVTTIMMVFNDGDILRRNACSPLSQVNMNFQLVLGNAIFAVLVWLVICSYNMLIYGKEALNSGSVLLCVNTLIYAIVGLSLGFLGGRFVKGGAAQSAYANVVALGISFISGVFVQQELLGDTVLKIASFTPGYWYVRAVSSIGNLTDYSFNSLKPVFGFMLIQIGFAAAIFIVAMTIGKQKKSIGHNTYQP